MNDTSMWKEFQINKLFTIKSPASRKMQTYDIGNIPYVSSGAVNNGIVSYLKPKDGEQLEKGHCITVSPLDGTSFYQKCDFLGRGGAGSAISLLYNDNLTELNALFICTVIKQSAYRFGYNDALTSDNLKHLIIKLPATPNGQPDWAYMESYMKQIMEESEKSLENLRKADDTKHLIDVSGWKRFHLYDDGMFGIDMGTKMDKAKMKEVHPTINFVGRANANNGITTCVDRIDDIEPYPSGYMTLSLGGEYLGSCFIQPKPFYTSQNVIVLIPNDNMTDNVKRFIATMIFRESRSKYKAFVDELNRHIKTDFSIYLPIISTGEPDWQYMEDYMKQIMDKSEQIISDLQIGA